MSGAAGYVIVSVIVIRAYAIQLRRAMPARVMRDTHADDIVMSQYAVCVQDVAMRRAR